MTLDVRAFWLIGALISSSCGLLILILRKQYADNLGRALTVFGSANVVLGLNYVIRLERARVGEFFFYVVAGMLVTLCLSLEYAAVCILKKRLALRVWVYAPPAFVLASCCWFTFVARNISIELMICNIVNMVLMVLVAITFLGKENGRRPFPDLIASCGYVCLALVSLYVIVDTLKAGNYPVEYDFNISRSILNNIAAILAEGIIFSVILLCLSDRLNHTLLEQAMHDPLTGAFNRRAFETAAFREISGALRSGLPLSLLVIDVDHFKRINDLYGHDAGDDLLRACADMLRGTLRDEDLLCRWGGDEFCALLPRAQRHQAEAAAQRLLSAFAMAHFSYARTPIKVTVSIGIADYRPGEVSLSPMFMRADSALYRIKEQGRNGYAFGSQVDPELDETILEDGGTPTMASNPPDDLPSIMA